MTTAIVLGQDLDVLMAVASLKLVFNAEVREMYGVIEVREVVVARPFFDFARVPIGSSVAVGPVPIPFLEKALVFALEVVLKDDATDVRALFTETLLCAQVRAIELGVMGQLTRPVDARVERLFPCAIAVASVCAEQVASAVRQRHRPLPSIERHGADQSLVAERANVVNSRVGRPVARIEQIAFGHDAEGARRRQRAALVAVELVAVTTVHDDFTFESPRQFETIQEDVTWIVITIARVAVALARVALSFAGIVVLSIGRWPASQLDPVHLDVAGIVIAIPRIAPSRIVIKHRRLPPAHERGRDCTRNNGE